MVNTEPDASSANVAAAPRARDRIRAARYLLGAAAGLFAVAALAFDLPPLYAAISIGILVVVAAAPPPLRTLGSPRSEGRTGLQVWPDTSMKATVEAVQHPTFVLDNGGIVRYANQRAAVAFPATRAGDPFTNTFRRPEFAEALEEASAGQTTSVEFREPGATRSFIAQLSPLRSPGGAIRFLLITFDDVSDRLAIARMRADFVANASHELRTPLASMTGFIETLLGPAQNDPQAQRNFLKLMLDEAWRMRRLIDDLLSLSRVEMRAHSRPTGTVDLVGVLRRVVDAMRPLAREQSVALSFDASGEERVTVVGDGDELGQVVQNLVENAIRYGASGERVEIGLELKYGERPRVAVHVRDYGPGIEAEHIPRLTERFYRVDVGASRQKKGTGLGLAIVKHILTRHAGDLSVKSEPGQGACFTVELPVAIESVNAPEKEPIS